MFDLKLKLREVGYTIFATFDFNDFVACNFVLMRLLIDLESDIYVYDHLMKDEDKLAKELTVKIDKVCEIVEHILANHCHQYIESFDLNAKS